jgi:hypothetical protein
MKKNKSLISYLYLVSILNDSEFLDDGNKSEVSLKNVKSKVRQQKQFFIIIVSFQSRVATQVQLHISYIMRQLRLKF